MALTREFKETIKARADRDPAFRAALLTEAIDLLLNGDVMIGKAVLRDYVNATIGFEKLATDVEIPTKSLMRMLSDKGNPSANNIFTIIHRLQNETGVVIEINNANKIT